MSQYLEIKGQKLTQRNYDLWVGCAWQFVNGSGKSLKLIVNSANLTSSNPSLHVSK